MGGCTALDAALEPDEPDPQTETLASAGEVVPTERFRFGALVVRSSFPTMAPAPAGGAR